MPDSAIAEELQSCSRLFGLTIRSDVPLPSPTKVAEVGVPDVEIVYDSVPRQLHEPRSSGLRYQVRPGELLLIVDGVARYLVSNGRRIAIEREPQADDDDVRVFLLGSALGGLLHQRGELVLHGSAVVMGEAAIAFVGPSGIGKSTLATAFARRGMRVLTDDLCVVRSDATSGLMQVHPGLPSSKLWLDSLEQLTIPSEGLARVRRKLEKRALPLGTTYARSPAPLKHVYALRSGITSNLSVAPQQGPAKFDLLKNQTYRGGFLEALDAKAAHFQNVVRLAQQASVSVVERPDEPFLIEELVALIMKDLGAAPGS